VAKDRNCGVFTKDYYVDRLVEDGEANRIMKVFSHLVVPSRWTVKPHAPTLGIYTMKREA